MNALDPRLPIIAAEAKVKTCHVYHCWHAMKQMGQSFHRQAFANFCGVEPHHVDAIVSALEAHKALPKHDRASQAKAERGTRLTRDFVIPHDWIAFAIAERGWTEKDARAEASIFVNYWCAKAGSDGVKLDWEATWRNWCRRSNRAGDFRPANGEWDDTAKREYQDRMRTLDARMGRARPIGDILSFSVGGK